jgi:5-methylcytosine-specific restriction endonuclease McrA
MPMRPRRPCAEPGCANFGVSGRSTCRLHAPMNPYGALYRKRRVSVMATATACAICGGGPRLDDPFQSDHVVPVARGGGADPVLRAVHRSCNNSKRDEDRR